MQRIGEFEARYRSGERATLYIWQEVVQAFSRGVPCRIPGEKCLRTENGETVTKISPGRFEIVSTGEVLTSDDPKAP